MCNNLTVIAHIESVFPQKFGVPRQSGLVDVQAKIIFEPEYRIKEAFRGFEEYSYIWLLWGFSQNTSDEWSPTVRPPKLGGNKRMGVFATRSPFRPNSIGLSSVRLVKIDFDSLFGPVLLVNGADLTDGTPIYDVKPYLPYTDSHPDARGGFSLDGEKAKIKVDFPPKLAEKIAPEYRNPLLKVLEQDPHPAYKNDKNRVYYMQFSSYEIGFTASDGVLTVCSVDKLTKNC